MKPLIELFFTLLIPALSAIPTSPSQPTVYYFQNDETVSYNLVNETYESVTGIQGLYYAPEKKSAYLEHPLDSELEIITSKTSHFIHLEFIRGERYVESWSPGGSYLAIYEPGQYHGGSHMHIVNPASGKHIVSLPLLNNRLIWLDDQNFYYLEPDLECEQDACANLRVQLKKYHLSDNSYSTVNTWASIERSYPQVTWDFDADGQPNYTLSDSGRKSGQIPSEQGLTLTHITVHPTHPELLLFEYVSDADGTEYFKVINKLSSVSVSPLLKGSQAHW